MKRYETGFYKNKGYLAKKTDEVISANIQRAVYEDNPVEFKYKFSEGNGLTREEYKMFQMWSMENNGYVIETASPLNFEKGDKIYISKLDVEEDNANYISKIVELQDMIKLNSNKKSLKNKKIIFCG